METNPIIFITWSGARSQEVAHVLKDLLCNIYELGSEKIFVSDTSLAGSRPWLEIIRNRASIAKIAIPCLTAENTEAPWIHYEVGLCSYIQQNQNDQNKEKAVIPVLFNFDVNNLNPRLTMISYHQLVTSNMTIDNETVRFQELLYSFIHQVDHCMAEKHLNCHYFGDKSNSLRKMCAPFVNPSADKLVGINQKYNSHDFYISRPMAIGNLETNNRISTIIDSIYNKNYKDKKIYYSKGTSGPDKDNLLESRIAIIKKCRSFILIYPRIENVDDMLPSSCFIELGAALATNSEIILCIQKGAKVPEFISSKIQNRDYQIMQFDKIEDLSEILSEIINPKKQ